MIPSLNAQGKQAKVPHPLHRQCTTKRINESVIEIFGGSASRISCKNEMVIYIWREVLPTEGGALLSINDGCIL